MQPGSLVGFGVVFVLIAWTLSVALTFLLWTGRRWVRRLGPAAERRAVELVAAIPVLLGIAVVTMLVVRSQVGIDHCQVHDHHVHLCLMHGAPWTEQLWAVTLVTLVVAISLVRLALLGVATLRRRGSVSRLRRACRYDDGIWWIDTPHALCFVSGFYAPEIFVSTGAWSALGDDERAAMLAHERAHVRQRDVARRFVLDLLLLAGAPFALLLRRAWDCATERLCDARAADVIGSGEAVASAMVKVCRLGANPSFSHASFTPPGGVLAERVEAVLAEEPAGDRAAHMLLTLVAAVASVLVLLATSQTESLHHVLESLLG